MRYKKCATKLSIKDAEIKGVEIKGTIIKREKMQEIEVRECVICLEDAPLCGEPVVKLSESLFNETVIKTCKCSCDIHAICAKKWVDMTHKCPICRTWCVVNLNEGGHMVIFAPQHMEINRFGTCKRFLIKCSQVLLCVIVFAHMHLILYVFIFSFFATFLP